MPHAAMCTICLSERPLTAAKINTHTHTQTLTHTHTHTPESMKLRVAGNSAAKKLSLQLKMLRNSIRN